MPTILSGYHQHHRGFHHPSTSASRYPLLPQPLPLQAQALHSPRLLQAGSGQVHEGSSLPRPEPVALNSDVPGDAQLLLGEPEVRCAGRRRDLYEEDPASVDLARFTSDAEVERGLRAPRAHPSQISCVYELGFLRARQRNDGSRSKNR